jgi:hypothetical protein
MEIRISVIVLGPQTSDQGAAPGPRHADGVIRMVAGCCFSNATIYNEECWWYSARKPIRQE